MSPRKGMGVGSVEVVEPRDHYRELITCFDGADDGADRRLAWYGQLRAKGLSHDEAMADTAKTYRTWVRVVWPLRGLGLPVDA